jgi:hypothetical protein
MWGFCTRRILTPIFAAPHVSARRHRFDTHVPMRDADESMKISIRPILVRTGMRRKRDGLSVFDDELILHFSLSTISRRATWELFFFDYRDNIYTSYFAAVQ